MESLRKHSIFKILVFLKSYSLDYLFRVWSVKLKRNKFTLSILYRYILLRVFTNVFRVTILDVVPRLR